MEQNYSYQFINITLINLKTKLMFTSHQVTELFGASKHKVEFNLGGDTYGRQMISHTASTTPPPNKHTLW